MADISILVVSCDRYADLWSPFFGIFWQRWPDCPYPVYLGSNQKPYLDDRVNSITVGEDLSWATGVRRMLDQIGSSHVILFLEDFLIQRPVDTTAVVDLVLTAVTTRVACLRLTPQPPPSLPICGRPGLGIIAPGDLYRVSTQVAVWRVDTLRSLLVPGFSAWDFELTGSLMSNDLPDQFWGVWEPAITYRHGVELGKWLPLGLSICSEAGVSVDLAARPVLTDEEIAARVVAAHWTDHWNGLKYGAIAHFLAGHRVEGMKLAVRYMRQKPCAGQLWGILVFGVLGPRPLGWIRKWYLYRRINKQVGQWEHVQ